MTDAEDTKGGGEGAAGERRSDRDWLKEAKKKKEDLTLSRNISDADALERRIRIVASNLWSGIKKGERVHHLVRYFKRS